MHEGQYDCQKCYDERRGETTRTGLDEFITNSNKFHDNKYDYNKVVYVNNKTKIIITCPIHGDFTTTPEKHLNRHQGCPKCANHNVTTEEFIEKAKKIHGNKYDYSKVNYIKNSDNILIGCSTHGYFETTPDIHLRGCGCPKCAGLYKTTEEYIKLAIKVHGDLYDYSKVKYIDHKTKICIICKKHGEFFQDPGNHLYGNGCPICKESRLEKLVRKILIESNIDFNYQKRFDWLGKQSLDFYLPNYNIAIECQGEQHFKSIDFFGGDSGLRSNIKRDVIKNELCKDNGLNLIYVINKVDLLNDILENPIFLDIYNKDNTICTIDDEIENLLLNKINQIK